MKGSFYYRKECFEKNYILNIKKFFYSFKLQNNILFYNNKKFQQSKFIYGTINYKSSTVIFKLPWIF